MYYAGESQEENEAMNYNVRCCCYNVVRCWQMMFESDIKVVAYNVGVGCYLWPIAWRGWAPLPLPSSQHIYTQGSTKAVGGKHNGCHPSWIRVYNVYTYKLAFDAGQRWPPKTRSLSPVALSPPLTHALVDRT